MRARDAGSGGLSDGASTHGVHLHRRANFSSHEQIDEVMQAAERSGAAWRILHVTCSDAVAEARLSRVDPENPAKNRNAALYRDIKNRFEAIEYPKLEVDTTGGVNAAVEDVCRYLKNRKE